MVEREESTLGVQVEHYHAENGIFKANGWVKDYYTKEQAMTYAGVNLHHQTGLADITTRWLQKMTRTALAQASRLWPGAITTHLWPYSLLTVNIARNNAPNMREKTGRTP